MKFEAIKHDIIVRIVKNRYGPIDDVDMKVDFKNGNFVCKDAFEAYQIKLQAFDFQLYKAIELQKKYNIEHNLMTIDEQSKIDLNAISAAYGQIQTIFNGRANGSSSTTEDNPGEKSGEGENPGQSNSE